MHAKTLLAAVAVLSLVCVAVSALYFVFAEVPKLDKLRTGAAALAAEHQLELDCAGQADRLADRMRQYNRMDPSFVANSRSHYNRELRKCLVRIDTLVTAGTTAFSHVYLLDGYENTSMLWWTYSGEPRSCWESESARWEGQSLQGRSVPMDCDQAVKRLDALVRK